MKKIISILLFSGILFSLSSCIILHPDDLPEPEHNSHYTTTVVTTKKYSITCSNETSYDVSDWFVKKSNTTNFTNSEYNRPIPSGRSDTIWNLNAGNYQLYFSFTHGTYQLQPHDYQSTGSFELKEDVTYTLYEVPNSVTYVQSRAAQAQNAAPKFILEGSDGSEIELVQR